MATVPPIVVKLAGPVWVPVGTLRVKSASEALDDFRRSELAESWEQASEQRWLQYEEEEGAANILDIVRVRAELAWRERKWREP